MTNPEIRLLIMEAGLKNWQVAHMLGMAEETFSRKMRYELEDEIKERIKNICDDVKKRKEEK